MSIPKKRRPLSSSKGAHYFDPVPAVESKPRKVHLHVGELAVELQADRGVFGSRGVDLGTLVLLKEAPPPPAQGDILDLGSGYGPIAITLAKQAPRARIWAVDVNERALELTRANAASAAVPNVTAHSPAEVPNDLRFDAIYSNPPVRIGKAVGCHDEAPTRKAAGQETLVCARGGRRAKTEQQIRAQALAQSFVSEQPLEAVDAIELAEQAGQRAPLASIDAIEARVL